MKKFFCEKSMTKQTYLTEEIPSLAGVEFCTYNPVAMINMKSNKIIITKTRVGRLMLQRKENQPKNKTLQGYLFLVRKLRGE